MKAEVSFNEKGRFVVNISKDLPIFPAIGMLFVGAVMLATGKAKPEEESKSEIVKEEK